MFHVHLFYNLTQGQTAAPSIHFIFFLTDVYALMLKGICPYAEMQFRVESPRTIFMLLF